MRLVLATLRVHLVPDVYASLSHLKSLTRSLSTEQLFKSFVNPEKKIGRFNGWVTAESSYARFGERHFVQLKSSSRFCKISNFAVDTNSL